MASQSNQTITLPEAIVGLDATVTVHQVPYAAPASSYPEIDSSTFIHLIQIQHRHRSKPRPNNCSGSGVAAVVVVVVIHRRQEFQFTDQTNDDNNIFEFHR